MLKETLRRGMPAPPTEEGLAHSGRVALIAAQDALAEAARRASAAAQRRLLETQQADGHWCAELEGDSILQSEYLLLAAFFGREHDERSLRIARHLLDQQLPSGGWGMFPGGRVEISGSVKAYFALKLTGHDPDAEPMRRARRAILAHGGADAVNSFTRFYLAMLGQIPYRLCPAVPPELVLLPSWSPVNLYAVSSWSRTIIVPLSIVSALKPVRAIEPERGISELFLRAPRDWPALRRPGTSGRIGWDRFFRTLDVCLKCLERWRLTPLRRRALRRATEWMLTRSAGSDGLGAIFPPIVFSMAALRALGYADDSPEIQACQIELEKHMLDDRERGSTRVQPCKSPVWDTALSMRALQASGFPAARAEAAQAAEWLVERQILTPGDWQANVQAEPGGWCFEYRNSFYPDADDTAMVLMALSEWAEETAAADPRRAASARQAVKRGLDWLLAFQNDDGGWGAFDRNNDRDFLCHVPFADHNAMIDPSTPDLAARVLECLGRLGRRPGDAAVDRAIDYLRRVQEADGSWYGRWGVNYIYGTWQAIVGLSAAGLLADDPAIVHGAQWLLRHQQAGGGWGESPASYEHPELRGQGAPTASQTAWAVLGLIAAGRGDHPAVGRGIRWLVERQRDDGGWDEPEFTGTGFPAVFYLRYHGYRLYFPLLALGAWLERG